MSSFLLCGPCSASVSSSSLSLSSRRHVRNDGSNNSFSAVLATQHQRKHSGEKECFKDSVHGKRQRRRRVRATRGRHQTNHRRETIQPITRQSDFFTLASDWRFLLGVWRDDETTTKTDQNRESQRGEAWIFGVMRSLRASRV